MHHLMVISRHSSTLGPTTALEGVLEPIAFASLLTPRSTVGKYRTTNPPEIQIRAYIGSVTFCVEGILSLRGVPGVPTGGAAGPPE